MDRYLRALAALPEDQGDGDITICFTGSDVVFSLQRYHT